MAGDRDWKAFISQGFTHHTEILDYAKNFYLSQEPAYLKFRNFLQNEIGMTYEDAYSRALNIWDKIQFDTDFQDIVQYIIDAYEDLMDDANLKKWAFPLFPGKSSFHRIENCNNTCPFLFLYCNI